MRPGSYLSMLIYGCLYATREHTSLHAWHCMHTGTDVARKMIILGRECGLAIEMQQVTVESLVPPQLANAKSAEEFMDQLPQVWPCPLAFTAVYLYVLCTHFLEPQQTHRFYTTLLNPPDSGTYAKYLKLSVHSSHNFLNIPARA